MSVRWSVCPYVFPSQAATLAKFLNAGSTKQRRTIAQGLQFSDAKDFMEIPMRFPTWAPNTRG